MIDPMGETSKPGPHNLSEFAVRGVKFTKELAANTRNIPIFGQLISDAVASISFMGETYTILFLGQDAQGQSVLPQDKLSRAWGTYVDSKKQEIAAALGIISIFGLPKDARLPESLNTGNIDIPKIIKATPEFLTNFLAKKFPHSKDSLESIAKLISELKDEEIAQISELINTRGKLSPEQQKAATQLVLDFFKKVAKSSPS